MTEPRTAVRRLALARVISVTGSAAAYTALMFEIYDQTGSSVWLAAALIVTEGVTGLVGPLASVLGDRFDRRTVMIVSDLAAAACFAGMAAGRLVARSAGGDRLPVGAGRGAVLARLERGDPEPRPAGPGQLGEQPRRDRAQHRHHGRAGGRGDPARRRRRTVGVRDQRRVVRGLRRTGRVGPRPFVGDRSDEGEHRGVWAGFRFLFHEPVLRRISVAWVVLVLGIGMAMVGDVPLVEVFGAGSAGFGVMIGLWGAGSILGSLAGRWLTAATEMRWLVLGTAFTACLGIAIALSPWFAARPGPERRLGSRRGDHRRRRAEPVPAPIAGLGAQPGPGRHRGSVPRRAHRLVRGGGVRAARGGGAGDVRDRRCGRGALGDRAAPAPRRDAHHGRSDDHRAPLRDQAASRRWSSRGNVRS